MADSEYRFILRLEGQQAVEEAKRIRQEILKEMSGALTISGMDKVKTDLEEIKKLSQQVGKSMFAGMDKEMAKVEERIANVASGLFGIINPLKASDDYVRKLAESFEAAGTASETGLARTIRAVETASTQIQDIDAQLNNMRTQMAELGSQPLLPRTVTGRTEPSRQEYFSAMMLVEYEKQLREKGRSLNKEQQAQLERVKENDRLYELALTREPEKVPDRYGYTDSLRAEEIEKTAHDLERMRVLYNEIEAMRQKRIALEHKIAKKTQSEPVGLPPNAKGTLADLVTAEEALGLAVSASLEPIRSQNRLWLKSLERMGQMVPLVKSLGENELGLSRIIAMTDERIGAEMQNMTETVKKENPFQWLTTQAKEAYDKIVGHSIIPDMVRGVQQWIQRMKTSQEGAFDPLEKEAQDAFAAVMAGWRSMYQEGAALNAQQMSAATGFSAAQLRDMVKRGELEGHQFSYRGRWVYPESEATRLYQEGNLGTGTSQLKQFDQYRQQRLWVEEQDRIYQQQLADMREPEVPVRPRGITGRIQGFSDAYYEQEMQRYGIERMGRGLQSTGRSMMFGGAGIVGSLALSANKYIDYNREMERSSRNLELNAELHTQLNQKLMETSRLTGMFSPQELAEGLYYWASGTGEVVKTEEDLNRVMGETTDIQKLAYMNIADLGDTTKQVGGIMGEFNLASADTGKIVQTLNYAAARSFAEVSDMGEAFKMVGPIAKSVGVTMEETSVTLQALADNGLRGSMAGRALRQMFIQLIDPSKEAQGTLAELFGAEWHEELFPQGEFVGVIKFIEMLDVATRKLTTAEKEQSLASITTANSLPAVLALLDEQNAAHEQGINVLRARLKLQEGIYDAETESYRNFIEQEYGRNVSLESALSTWDRMWQRAEEADNMRADRLKQRWETALISIGQAAFQSSVPFLESVADAMNVMAGIIDAHPILIQAAGAIGVGMFTAGFITKTIGDIVIAANTLASIIGAGTAINLNTAALTTLTASVDANTLSQGGTVGTSAAGGVLRNIPGLGLIATAFAGDFALREKISQLGEDITGSPLGRLFGGTAYTSVLPPQIGVPIWASREAGKAIADAIVDVLGLRPEAAYYPGASFDYSSSQRRVPGLPPGSEGEYVSKIPISPFGDAQLEALSAYEDYLKDREDLVKNYNKRLTDMEKDLAKALLDLERDTNKRRQSIIEDSARAIESKRVDAERKIQDVIKNANDSLEDVENDHRKKLRDIEESFSDSMEDAIRTRDARAILEAIKKRDRDLRDASEARSEKIDDLTEQRDDRIAEINETLELERQQREEDRDLQLQELEEQYAQQKQERLDAYNEQRSDLGNSHQLELSELDSAGREKMALALGWIDTEKEARKLKYGEMLDDLRIFLAQEQALLGGTRYIDPAQASTSLTAQTTGWRYAEGGYAGYGLAMLGERGREFVLNASTTRSLERDIGYLSQDKIAGAMMFGGASEHRIVFDNVPAGISQAGLEQAVFKAMDKAFGGARSRIVR